ncbi:hypothetical protein HDU76_002497 [Blyttiomyces sp. JEL0837]|nr:hypothetical protein HDU76_002497 [Blyttiomyces sp. JEL0837]
MTTQDQQDPTNQPPTTGGSGPFLTVQITENPTRTNPNIPVTLYRILAPYRLDEDTFFKENQGSMYIVKRLLGMFPQTMTTMGLFKPAKDLVGKCAPVLNNSPMCDLGFGVLSAHLRRLIQTLTAQVATCGFRPEDLTSSERDALRLVIAAVKVPARVNPTIRSKALSTFTPAGYQIIIRPMALIAYLSVIMETLGCELEPECASYASTILTDKEWVKDRAVPNDGITTHGYSKYWDPNLPDPCETSISKILGRNSFTSLIDLFYNIAKAESQSPKTDIPKSNKELDLWFLSKMGFIPRFIQSIIDPALKHVMAYTIYTLVFADPQDKYLDTKNRPMLNSDYKIISAFVYFVSAENGLLARQFAAIAIHRGIPASTLLHSLQVAKTMKPATIDTTTRKYIDPSTNKPRTILDHMTMMCYAEARRSRYELDLLSEQVLDIVDRNSQSVMEIVSLCAVLAMYQRVSACLDDRGGVEDGVKKLLERDAESVLNGCEDLSGLEEFVCPSRLDGEVADPDGLNMAWGGYINY